MIILELIFKFLSVIFEFVFYEYVLFVNWFLEGIWVKVWILNFKGGFLLLYVLF